MSRRVAIIGASNDRRKFGNKALRAFRHQGYTVYPINPHADHVEGVPAFRSVLDVPGEIDMATMYVPPRVGAQVVGELAAKGIREVWFNPGSATRDLVDRARGLGLEPIEACSIIGIGEAPGAY
ncbi:MAG TPA: CoA-binding protein [Methylomirabilota bacterium]